MRFLFLVTLTVTVAGAFATATDAVLVKRSSGGGGALSGEFTASLGGTYPYTISAITVDSQGNLYVVGSRQLGATGLSSLLGGTVRAAYFGSGPSDVFVSKLDSLGNLVFTDTFAGKGVDAGAAIALDLTGNIYIAGTTTSDDFPLSKALQTRPSASGAAFIIKLTNDGSTILYSTYFGGTLGATSISSLATDSKGNLFLTGVTSAADFPHTNGMPPAPLQSTFGNAMVSCISADGDKLLFSGVFTGGLIPVTGGAAKSTAGVGVAVDAAGNAYFAGNTGILTMPTTPGVLAPSGSYTGFLAKVNTASGTLSYLTYLPTYASALAVDAAGNAYIAGYSGGNGNAPVLMSLAKINPSASTILWTNNLGGAEGGINSIAIDPSGDVWATGQTSASTFPNANGWTNGPEFLVGLNPTGTGLTYSALFPAGTVGQSVTAGTASLIHVAGVNGFVSAIAPAIVSGGRVFALQNGFGGSLTGRISPMEVISIYGPGIGPATPSTATPANGRYPTTLAGIQVAINGVNMPLLYVSANQINAVVPMGVAQGAATVHIINGVVLGRDYPVWITAAAPQAYPTALNQDGTINSPANPAPSGSVVTFYATGWQSSFIPLTDGEVATTAQDTCSGLCQATPGGTVLYGGAAPGTVAGVSQLNVQLGSIAGGGAIQLNIYAAGALASVTQTVWVAP